MVRRERLLFQPLFNRGNQIALWSNTYNVFPCPNAYLNSLERIQDPSKVFWNQYPEYWRWWIYSFEWHGFYKENYRTELRTDMRNVLGLRGWRKLEDFIRPSVLLFPTQGIFFLNLSCFSFLFVPSSNFPRQNHCICLIESILQLVDAFCILRYTLPTPFVCCLFRVSDVKEYEGCQTSIYHSFSSKNF